MTSDKHHYEREAILKPKTENNIGAPVVPQNWVCMVTWRGGEAVLFWYPKSGATIQIAESFK